MRHHAILPAPHLKQARLQMIEQGIDPRADIDRRVAQSWQRSFLAGLSPRGHAECEDNLSASNLRHARDFNHDLISHSEPVIEYLFEQVKHSHSMVILADAQGVLMHTLGDLDFLNKADRVALKCGASWAENQRGTNAIGTALAECNEIEIHGAEHYLEPNEFLTCAAAPILSAQGQLMGILDISGDHRSRHPHTLGLVSTAAQMIENSMVLSSGQHQVLLQLHTRVEGIGSVAQAVLAFSEDAYLVGANRKALSMLQLQYADMRALHWSQLFDTSFEQMLTQQMRQPSQQLQLRTKRGSELFAQVHPNSLIHRFQTVHSFAQRPQKEMTANVDQQWQSALDKACRVIDKGIPLLVAGESGVGKEVFANAVHSGSARAEQNFVAVNCAAIPEHLIEAELFGYVAGAFTGANRQGAQGRIREAHGGTLFLDEIGDMPLALQTRLLRVLQERQITPLGSSTAIAVDFNLICATHQPLKQRVSQGLFREDLFYRINGLQLSLPALRERTDFAPLCARILSELSPRQRLQIAPELMQAMRQFAWPGNLRQLHHCLRTAVALLDEDEKQIDWQHLAFDVAHELGGKVDVNSACKREQRGDMAMTDLAPVVAKEAVHNLRALSLQMIEQALVDTHGNVSAAARRLGISRQTMYRKMQER